MSHLRVQGALVRMIYDPVFAAVVRDQPDQVLAELPPPMRRALAEIDPRALRRDALRRERTLGQLCEELPGTTTLVLCEVGQMLRLLAFFGSAEFHQAIEERASLVLALGAYLERLLAERTLRSAHTAAVLALELSCARARRSTSRPSLTRSGVELLRRAPGVEPVEVPAGALQTLQATERHRFRLGLLPWGQANDPPALDALPVLGPGRATLCAIAVDEEVSLVEIERALHAVLISLPGPRTRDAVTAEASLRLGGDRSAAETALAELCSDELILTS
jgi:hypothetical protein